MSEIRNLIKETNKTTRKGRMINNILWIIVTVLVILSVYTTMLSIDLKEEAQKSELVVIQERDAKKEALIISDSLRRTAESLVIYLKISEENLQGEKDKLEEIKIKYDSLRQVQLEQMEHGDELWDYAVKENTIESYSDYIKIKGSTDEAINKITSLLKRTGYVQIQESNGNMLIKPIESGFWIAKSARSIRNGVMGNKNFRNTNRNGDVILKGQPFLILQDSLMSGKTRWAKISY